VRLSEHLRNQGIRGYDQRFRGVIVQAFAYACGCGAGLRSDSLSPDRCCNPRPSLHPSRGLTFDILLYNLRRLESLRDIWVAKTLVDWNTLQCDRSKLHTYMKYWSFEL